GTASDWAWGTPAHPSISSAGGGTKSWCIGGLTGSFYNLGELSTLTGPCYDFSSLSYPWISLKIYWECEFKWDGLVLQSSINNGLSWQNVGAFGDPNDCNTANWYTYGNISNLTSLPAGQRCGWTGRVGPTSGSCSGGNGSGGWVTAKHCLTGLANQPNVKFRFVFGSGTTCNNYDGIAIDDILISNGMPNSATSTVSCLGSGTFSFSAASAGCVTPSSFSWNFGDPASGAMNTSVLQNQSHTFSAPGTYTVRLIVSGGQCNPPDTTYRVIAVANGSVASSVKDVTCYGSANGSATVSVTGVGPCTYSWTPNVGNTPVVTNLVAGNYSVTIHDAGNCLYSKALSIGQPPALTAIITSTSNGCALNSGSSTVAVSGGTSPYAYSWSPSGGTSNSASGLAPGTYSITVTDAVNCVSVFSTTIVSASTLSAQINGLQLCKGQSGVLTASVTGGAAPYAYVWNGMAGSSTLPVNGTSNSIYTLNVTDKNGCAALPDTASVNVLAPLSLNLPPMDSVCPGPVVLNAGVTGGNGNYSYLWLPQNSTAPSLSLNITTPQSYTLTVSDGCTVPDVQATGSIALYNIPVSAITVNKTSGCSPLCVTFSDPPLDAAQILLWSWNFGDNAASSSPAHCYTKGGTYSVSVKYVTDKGCTGSQTIADYITVFDRPLAEFNTSTLETDIYNPTVDFYNYSQHAMAFQWYFASGAGFSNEKNPSYTFSAEGTYAIFLVAKNEKGCADTASRVIKINPAFAFFAPDAFTANSDNLNDRFLPVGTGWDVSTYDLSIFDSWGELIFHTNRYDEGWDGKLKGAYVKNDVYVWKVILKDVQAQRYEFAGHVTLLK
ncbi:MAG: PKD domain-containing protein, partial [Bacteroidia bacterium]